MDKIICARDLAERDNLPNVRSWLAMRSRAMVTAHAYKNAWDGNRMSDAPQVQAFVNHNRWLARCPFCNAVEYVDDQSRVFFCTRCGNNDTGMALVVIFPENLAEIETILRQKPVELGQGLSVVEKNLYGKNDRNWLPDELNGGQHGL
jgi:ribosomal protein L37AE/L43A